MLEKEVICENRLSKVISQTICVLSPTNFKRGKVQHIHMQIVFMSYFYNPVY